MTYTSLQSPANKDYQFELNVAHLYGNLMNTYGDNGNILMMKYVGEKLGAKMTFDIVSLGDDFDADYYDMVFFGGGQDYEQSIVAKDLPGKKKLSLISSIKIKSSLLSVVASNCLVNTTFKQTVKN